MVDYLNGNKSFEAYYNQILSVLVNEFHTNIPEWCNFRSAIGLYFKYNYPKLEPFMDQVTEDIVNIDYANVEKIMAYQG